MLPYAMNQEVKFEKGFGPKLGDLNIDKINETNELDFTNKLNPVYKAILKTSKSDLLLDKDLIGFVGAPWTILVYMINKISPKNGLSEKFFSDHSLINILLDNIEKFLKLHIKNQINAGANVIQIFDSWAGLLTEKDLPKYVIGPTLNLVNFVKSLNTPVICFPRNIKNYKEYCNTVKPDVINIDYEVDPKDIKDKIDIVIQGGLDPKILLTDKQKLKKKVVNYLDIFKEHPYIFNLGHGVLPETNPQMVEELIKIVKTHS